MRSISNGSQLLADSIVKIMSESLLLPVGDLQNLLLHSLSCGHVTRNSLHFNESAGLFNHS